MTSQDAAALRLVPSSRNLSRLSRVLCVLVLFIACALGFAPWQQSASGSGRVIAYAPLDRQQIIEAPIDGRIQTWHVAEGSRVKKGDLVAEINDNDPDILSRLERESDAAEQRVAAAGSRATSIEARILSLEASRSAAMSAANERVRVAQARVAAAQRAVDAARAGHATTEVNLERIDSLSKQGLRSTRDLELARLDEVRAKTDLDRAIATHEGARAEKLAADSDLLKVGTDGSASIDDARASRAAALAEAASASAELARIEVRLHRQGAQRVIAPRDGTILRLLATQGSETVKPGDGIAILVPDTETRAVELWVDGNDVPLISVGRHVRLQFEGWPAVQFTGWPSVAVGTFGGTVALVDATDDGSGNFRIVVLPDEGEGWPSGAYLRQGTQCNGWVLLDRVKLGYELWRRFNGFPPTVKQPPEIKEKKK